MNDFQLGQPVRFTDRLVRISLSYHREDVLQEAMDLMGISRTRGSRKHDGLDWKFWVPTKFARKYLHDGLVMLTSLEGIGTDEGFIVQRATLQQGGTRHSYEDVAWLGHGTTRAYKIAHSLNRNPIHALPGDITPLEPTRD